MRLYTVCVDQRPILVLSADAEHPVPEEFVKDPETLTLLRSTDSLITQMRALDSGLEESVNRREIDEALDTWLGSDLQVLEVDDRPIWDGDRSRLKVRPAATDEASRWHHSRQHAIDTGEQDAGNESWLVFLARVTEPEE